ncbi:MAG: threonylcarbamoyl-AMP synthase [Lentisphaerae bacterium]|nr:threonylcarbamoyl-AMP synthase [Lentisphaerota bacterium]
MSGTEIFRVTPGSEREIIRNVSKALRRGLLAVVPTDTVYGLVADPSFPDAVQRIYETKLRDKRKPIPLLVATVHDAENFGARFGHEEKALASKFWPGPLTLVLDCKSRGRSGRIVETKEGFRIPGHDLMLCLIKEMGGVLRATSANISGEPPALTVNNAVASLGASVAVAIDVGTVKIGLPSTVARIKRDLGSGNVRVEILRQGVIDAHSLEQVVMSVGGRQE